MIKRKKALIALCVAINILIVTVMIAVMYSYASQNIENLKEKNFDSASDANESITDAVFLYFEQQQRNILNEKLYISENRLTYDEAVDYIRMSGKANTTVYEIIDCSTYKGIACAPDGTVREIAYSSSYENIYALCGSAKNNTINDSVFNATESFTNPLNGVQSIALYTSLSLKDDNSDTENYLLMAVDKLSDMVGSGLPTPPYQNAGAAIIDIDGDYITKSAGFKSENIYEFFRIYNELDYAASDEIRQNVIGDDSGYYELFNSKGEKCLFNYSKIPETNGWYYFSLIPENAFEESNIDYHFAVILSIFVLVLAMFDAGIIALLNHRLKTSLESESISRQTAEKANLAKSEFLSRMSHEIRTPLNAVIGYNSLARDALSDINEITEVSHKTVRIDDCLNKSSIASKHLLSVINDVLDMSSIESGKIKITREKFDFTELIASITTMFNSLASDKGVNFDVIPETKISEQFSGDQMRIKQILTNLLGNAVKFTPKDGSVTLAISEKDIDDNNAEITFTVKDTGIGMDKEFLANLWQPFEQADSSISRKFGGSGLGLAITKKLVELSDGRIDVISEKDVGSEFTVMLPLIKCQDEASEKICIPDFGNMYALIADDEKRTCEYLAMLFARYSIKCKTVNSGYAALNTLREAQESGDRFTLCMIDWQMPGINGIETAKRIKEEFGEKMPVVVITAYDFSEIEADSLQNGVCQFISKPIFQSTLFDLLVNLTRRKPQSIKKKSPVYDFTGVRALLAEDNLMNMEIGKALLSKVGITVDGVSNGEECVKAFATSAPDTYDVIFMDIQMPKLDGYEATKQIRLLEHPRAKDIPIIAMTADAFKENVEMALNSGMNDHIAKPINIDQLYASLDKFIRNPKNQ